MSREGLFSFPPTAEEIADPNLMPPLDHGNCPACGHDQNGGSIWEHFYRRSLHEGMDDTAARVEADRSAEMYGASERKGRWGLAIGMSNWDSVYAWGCTFCKALWDRRTGAILPEKLETPE